MENEIIVLDKHRAPVATLCAKDGLFEDWIDTRINGESTLSFKLSDRFDKWNAIAVAENIFLAGGREFSALKEDAFDTLHDESDTVTYTASLVENWYDLSTDYVTAYNSKTDYDHIDTFMVVLTSGGEEPLNINGAVVTNPYEKGSAAYALFAVLYGTEWSVGVVDVTEKHDLETDKKSRSENVKEIQSIWGGLLFWDSANKVVHLRNEETYKPDSGYTILYTKNMQSMQRTQSNALITRLYIFGKEDLNISSVNDGKEYIDDFTYTDRIYMGILRNEDIVNPEELKNWGLREIKDVCRPKFKYTVKHVDLSSLPEYSHERYMLGDMINVDDKKLGETVKKRIIKYRFCLTQPALCDIEIGDDEKRWEVTMDEVIKTSDKVKNMINGMGKINASHIETTTTKG